MQLGCMFNWGALLDDCELCAAMYRYLHRGRRSEGGVMTSYPKRDLSLQAYWGMHETGVVLGY